MFKIYSSKVIQNTERTSRSYGRRRFIVAAASGFMTLTGFVLLGESNTFTPVSEYTFDVLKSASADYSSAVAVGNCCLASCPESVVEAQAYFRSLGRVLAMSGGEIEKDKRAYKISLQAMMRKDIQDGNVLLVDGWFLSEYEVKYCATVAWAELEFLGRV